MCLLVCLSNMFVPDYFLSNFHLAFYHLIGWILVFLSNSLLCSCICSLLNWFLTPLVSVLKYFFLYWSICLYNSCLDPLVYIVLFMSSLKIYMIWGSTTCTMYSFSRTVQSGLPGVELTLRVLCKKFTLAKLQCLKYSESS